MVITVCEVCRERGPATCHVDSSYFLMEIVKIDKNAMNFDQMVLKYFLISNF